MDSVSCCCDVPANSVDAFARSHSRWERIEGTPCCHRYRFARPAGYRVVEKLFAPRPLFGFISKYLTIRCCGSGMQRMALVLRENCEPCQREWTRFHCPIQKFGLCLTCNKSRFIPEGGTDY